MAKTISSPVNTMKQKSGSHLMTNNRKMMDWFLCDGHPILIYVSCHPMTPAGRNFQNRHRDKDYLFFFPAHRPGWSFVDEWTCLIKHPVYRWEKRPSISCILMQSPRHLFRTHLKSFLQNIFGFGRCFRIAKAYCHHFPAIPFVQSLLSDSVRIAAPINKLLFSEHASDIRPCGLTFRHLL